VVEEVDSVAEEVDSVVEEVDSVAERVAGSAVDLAEKRGCLQTPRRYSKEHW
jgi:methyl-accepting chemotaxis protein